MSAAAGRIADAARGLGLELDASSARTVGGGSINEAWRFESTDGPVFVKTNVAERLDMFEAERAGLDALSTAGTVRVPKPLGTGKAGGHAFLVLEWLELGGASRKAGSRLGEQLAAMHRNSHETFGWYRANTIGSTPQPNDPDPNWIRFYAERRLGFQLGLGRDNGFPTGLVDAVERLIIRLGDLFSGYDPSPSLLHGDLWGGNQGVLTGGEPVIFDPAVYYGDREADIAMTELFGGFSRDFYAAYRATWPLDAGYEIRKSLYNLYHVLNHANLFGGGYAAQAERMTETLLAEVA